MAKGKYGYWLTGDGLLLLAAWVRDGLTDEELASKMKIAPSTLYAWKIKFPEISEALKKGKEIVDIEVENALYKNATGYDYTEDQAFKVKRVFYDDDNRRCEQEEIEVVEIRRHKPPETAAQAFWLKNRKPVEWRDKPQGGGEAQNGGGVVMLPEVSRVREPDDGGDTEGSRDG